MTAQLCQHGGDEYDICERLHKGNPESVAANTKASKHKRSNKRRIIKAVLLCGDCTCEELEGLLGLSHQTTSARLSDLKRDGAILQVGTHKAV